MLGIIGAVAVYFTFISGTYLRFVSANNHIPEVQKKYHMTGCVMAFPVIITLLVWACGMTVASTHGFFDTMLALSLFSVLYGVVRLAKPDTKDFVQSNRVKVNTLIYVYASLVLLSVAIIGAVQVTQSVPLPNRSETGSTPRP